MSNIYTDIEFIDALTDLVMDVIRKRFNIKEDSDLHDEIYEEIYERITNLHYETLKIEPPTNLTER